MSFCQTVTLDPFTSLQYFTSDKINAEISRLPLSIVAAKPPLSTTEKDNPVARWLPDSRIQKKDRNYEKLQKQKSWQPPTIDKLAQQSIFDAVCQAEFLTHSKSIVVMVTFVTLTSLRVFVHCSSLIFHPWSMACELLLLYHGFTRRQGPARLRHWVQSVSMPRREW